MRVHIYVAFVLLLKKKNYRSKIQDKLDCSNLQILRKQKLSITIILPEYPNVDDVILGRIICAFRISLDKNIFISIVGKKTAKGLFHLAETVRYVERFLSISCNAAFRTIEKEQGKAALQSLLENKCSVSIQCYTKHIVPILEV